MAFHRSALAFPTGLRGTGAQVHFELAMCLWAQEQGFRIVYDPALLVDHHPRERFDADRRDRPASSAVSAWSYNLVLCQLSFRRYLLIRRLLYGLLIGDAGSPGVGRTAYAMMRGDLAAARRLVPSLHGQMAAAVAIGAGRPLAMNTN